MAFLFENANGFSFGTDSSILDIVPTDLHQRTPVFLGEKNYMKVLNELSIDEFFKTTWTKKRLSTNQFSIKSN